MKILLILVIYYLCFDSSISIEFDRCFKLKSDNSTVCDFNYNHSDHQYHNLTICFKPKDELVALRLYHFDFKHQIYQVKDDAWNRITLSIQWDYENNKTLIRRTYNIENKYEIAFASTILNDTISKLQNVRLKITGTWEGPTQFSNMNSHLSNCNNISEAEITSTDSYNTNQNATNPITESKRFQLDYTMIVMGIIFFLTGCIVSLTFYFKLQKALKVRDEYKKKVSFLEGQIEALDRLTFPLDEGIYENPKNQTDGIEEYTEVESAHAQRMQRYTQEIHEYTQLEQDNNKRIQRHYQGDHKYNNQESADGRSKGNKAEFSNAQSNHDQEDTHIYTNL